ncbi:MAG: hypothetical protein ACTS84_03195 [Arsenophonus sp. NC-LC2-MAG3]
MFLKGITKQIGTEGLKKDPEKNHGPVKEEDKYRIKYKESYQKLHSIIIAMGKKRLIFYGHLLRMNIERLALRMFSTISRGKANKAKWMRIIRKDLEQLD